MAVSKTTIEGVQAVELTTPALRLAAVTEFGPRIAFLGKPDGNNLLMWAPGQYTRKGWDLRGGHRVWVARPKADESEETYACDNFPCEVELLDNGFCVTGAENPINATRRGIRITMRNDYTVDVDNFLINAGDMLYSAAVWAITCTVPTEGCRYAVPVGDGSSWDAFNMVCFREWAGHGQGGFGDDQFRLTEDLFLLEPRGIENKRMVQSHAGIVAMSDPVNDVTFAKKAGYDPVRSYPLNTNIALYVGPDNFMVEMETMGPETPMKPGDELHHVETWVLRDGAATLDSQRAVADVLT